MKYNELNNKSAKELTEMNKTLREELFGLKLKNTTSQLEKKSQIRQVRRDIARVQTKLAAVKNEGSAKA